MLISCGFWCRRRYRRPATADYVIIRRPDATMYGSTLYGTVSGETVSASAPGYVVQGPVTPQVSHSMYLWMFHLKM